MFPSSLLMAVRIESVALRVPAAETNPVSALPVTVGAATNVAPCVPVTSPANAPLKVLALPVILPVTLPVTLPVSGPLKVPA